MYGVMGWGGREGGVGGIDSSVYVDIRVVKVYHMQVVLFIFSLF